MTKQLLLWVALGLGALGCSSERKGEMDGSFEAAEEPQEPDCHACVDAGPKAEDGGLPSEQPRDAGRVISDAGSPYISDPSQYLDDPFIVLADLE